MAPASQFPANFAQINSMTLICRVPDLRRLELRGPASDSALESVLALSVGDEKKSLAAEMWGYMSRTGDSHSDAIDSCCQHT